MPHHQLIGKLNRWRTQVSKFFNTLAYQTSSTELEQTLANLENGSIQADQATVSLLLNSCTRITELRRVHSLVDANNYLLQNPSLGRHLVQMYIKLGSLLDAHSTFDQLLKSTKPGVVLWTALISGYAREGHFKQALQVFEEMQKHHVIPDKVTFIAVLSAIEELEQAKKLHIRISEAGYDTDLVVGNALINTYVRCGSLEKAQKVFDEMEHRDVVSWTVIISANAKLGDSRQAILLFRKMQLQGNTPNKVTFLALLSSCEDSRQAEMMHQRVIESGFLSDLPVCNSILNMYSRCRELDLARRVFDRMPVRNTVSWTSMIAACIKNGSPEEALKLFRDMQEDEGAKPDWITFITVLDACQNAATARWIHGCIIRSGFGSETPIGNAMINTYTRCGSLKEACQSFSAMAKRDQVSWTAMISAYAAFGRLKRALRLFREMQLEGFQPNLATMLAVVNACGNGATLKEGTLIHRLIESETSSDLKSSSMLATALLNMYGKCGSLGAAWTIFDGLPKQDVVSWTSMIASFAHNGEGDRASTLFSRMQVDGVKPVEVTFVSIVSACGHAGLVELGCDLFSEMIQEHGVKLQAEHCGCVVDLLGRAGKLEEAEYFIDRMPFKPTPMVWMSFLAACKMHNDLRRGQKAAAQILGLDAKTTAAVIALSDSYAASGRAADADTLRRLIADGGLDQKLLHDF